MIYDFNKPVDRLGSLDIKHEALQQRWGRTDLLPLWVADMDWETPEFITEALRKRIEHSLYGYTITPQTYWQSIINWVGEHHGWQLKKEWLSFIPGIVKGIGMAVNALSEKGDGVVIQPPVYHPFRFTTVENNRCVVENPLLPQEDKDGHLTGYRMNLEGLERSIREFNKRGEGRVKLLVLCNPHNPAGICWDRETLRQLAHICAENQVVVLSDEIHCDMALFGNRHVPFATVSEEAQQWSITFSSPSKTFNIAGIVSSWAVVPNDELRCRYYSWIDANEFGEPTIFSPIATEAAFTNGEEWRRQMLAYVEGNIEYVESFCRGHFPLIHVVRPQASFLVWLDCRELKARLDADADYTLGEEPNLVYSPHGNRLLDFFIDKAHLALNDGEMFGQGGEGFVRLNIATQRPILEQAMNQLLEAYNNSLHLN